SRRPPARAQSRRKVTSKSLVYPHACGLISQLSGQFGRCAGPKSGGAIRALGRPCGANVDPHACGLIEFGRCAAPKSGAAIRALGRPGGAHAASHALTRGWVSTSGLTTNSGLRPFNASTMLASPVDAMLWKHSSVQHSECGVTITLSMV